MWSTPFQSWAGEQVVRGENGLIAEWLEVHPLFDGAEFDVAIIGLKTTFTM